MEIDRAPVARGWMDQSPQRFSYRCLPLNIANAYGWQISMPSRIRVRWSGANSLDALKFRYSDPLDPPATSHFGMGIVTFHIPALIKTPPGVSIFVTGPINSPKPGITALSGIVETDWLPFTFTMNWKMNAVDQWVEFKEGEPFCMFFPVRIDDIESYDVDIGKLEDNAELRAQVDEYAQARNNFLQGLKDKEPSAVEAGWQKDYFRGVGAPEDSVKHRTALNLSRPRNRSEK